MTSADTTKKFAKGDKVKVTPKVKSNWSYAPEGVVSYVGNGRMIEVRFSPTSTGIFTPAELEVIG